MKKQLEHIGKIVELELNGMKVEVKIEDYKNSYGRDRWLVTPVAGSGKVWVQNINLA